MNLDRLRAVQVDERGTDSLQPLADSFYRDVADYLHELREQRDAAAAAAEDPFQSDEVRRLTDEIATVEEVVEAIYDRRMGKVVNRASLAAAGIQTDEGGLTEEEAELFDGLVSLITANRRDVLSTIDSGASAIESSDDEPASPPPDAPPDRAETRDEDAGGDDPPAEEAAAREDEADRLTVRITKDVGEIFGIDERVYDLAAEDVVSLPAANAEPLLDRNAAQKLG